MKRRALSASPGPAVAIRRYYHVPIAIRIVGGLALLAGIGTVLLLLPGVSTTHPLTLQQALFTSVSAVSVTGLSVITPAQDLTWFGQAVLLVLIQMGGVGFMVVTILILRALRRPINLVDRLALRESLGLPEKHSFAPIVRRVILSVFIVEGLGACLLWLTWREQLGNGRAVWYGLFHAVSAFCNAGFDLFSGLARYPYGLPRDWHTLTIMGTIIVLGGLGFPVLADVVTWRARRRLSLHSRLTLGMAAVLIVVGALGIFIAESGGHGTFSQLDVAHRWLYATFQSISMRTAGFSALGDLSMLTPASQILTVGLMAVGTGPASMGGGITTGTVVVLALLTWSYARGGYAVQVSGRTLPVETTRRAAAVLAVSVSVIIIATWLVLITNPATLDQALFEVVSAFATTGLSLDFTGQLNSIGLVIIMVMMFWGRLGTLALILALARQRPPSALGYPEEEVLIG
jgi:trk system potassium uptake protein